MNAAASAGSRRNWQAHFGPQNDDGPCEDDAYAESEQREQAPDNDGASRADWLWSNSMPTFDSGQDGLPVEVQRALDGHDWTWHPRHGDRGHLAKVQRAIAKEARASATTTWSGWNGQRHGTGNPNAKLDPRTASRWPRVRGHRERDRVLAKDRVCGRNGANMVPSEGGLGRDSMISLLNLHGQGGVPEHVQYIGRAGRTGQPPRSPLSNPFTVERHGDDALRFYRLHLVAALASADPAIIGELARLEQLAQIGGLTLGCWCVTRPAAIDGLGAAEPERRCHGDIVATVLTHWGVRLATFARGIDGTPTPDRWSAWVTRDCGSPPHAVLASVFGLTEVRAMAKVRLDAADLEALGPTVEAIAAGILGRPRR